MEKLIPEKAAGDVPQDVPMPTSVPQGLVVSEGLLEVQDHMNSVLVSITQLTLANLKLNTERERLLREIYFLQQENRRLRKSLGLEQPADDSADESELRLPPLLDTERARAAFGLARKRGLLRVEPDGHLTWTGTSLSRHSNASELAYFCGLVYDFLGLRERHTGTANSFSRELKALFRTDSELYKLYIQVENSAKTRPWIRVIQELFDEPYLTKPSGDEV